MLCHAASGQDILRVSSDRLKEDLTILKTTLVELHPDIYRYTPKENLSKLLTALRDRWVPS